MDRFSRPLLACSLGLVLASTGCRSTQQEVPPGRAYAKDGQPRQAIQFSSQGHPASVQGSAPTMPNGLGGSDLAAGIGAGGRPDPSSFGGPPAGYGPPGTSGAPNLTDSSTTKASTTPASSIPLTGTPPEGAPVGLPPLGPAPAIPESSNLPDLNVTPPRESQSVPNQVIQTPIETPGTMGTSNQLPSPN